MTEVFVLDTETTGLGGGPNDLVVDIGIVLADLESGEIEEVFASKVGYPKQMIRNEYAWVFTHTDLTVRDVVNAPGAYRVIERVKEILCGELVTSYNTEFDFDRFLYRDPWGMQGIFAECNCIMTSVWKAFPEMGHNGYFPKLQTAYSALCPDDPAGIGGIQRHRALSDANVAANVMCALYRMGKYKPGA